MLNNYIFYGHNCSWFENSWTDLPLSDWAGWLSVADCPPLAFSECDQGGAFVSPAEGMAGPVWLVSGCFHLGSRQKTTLLLSRHPYSGWGLLTRPLICLTVLWYGQYFSVEQEKRGHHTFSGTSSRGQSVERCECLRILLPASVLLRWSCLCFNDLNVHISVYDEK